MDEKLMLITDRNIERQVLKSHVHLINISKTNSWFQKIYMSPSPTVLKFSLVDSRSESVLIVKTHAFQNSTYSNNIH